MTGTPPAAGRTGRPAPARFHALGPVQATVAGRTVDLGAPKQRTLLALLVSQAGRTVSTDVILEALWEGSPPPSAMTSLQAYVAKLRKVLEPHRAPRTPAAVLRTRPGGYVLDAPAADIDVHRFTAHAEAGRRARDRQDPQGALHEFDAGLALWRGQPFTEVSGVSCVVPEVARLEETRLAVVEMRCAALLALGAHEAAVAELRAFVQANPLREYGCELLSLALYRAGRQADALEVLRALQASLSEELGVDPTLRLQHMRQQILHQDPELDWRPAPRVPAARPAPHDDPAPRTFPHPPGPAGPAALVRGAGEEVFVGREAAVRRLTEALAAAEAGRGQVVLVSGEPGAGKTSLLRRFAERSGVPVLWGTCAEHLAPPPLSLWQQVLRAADTAFPHHPAPRTLARLLTPTPHPNPGTQLPGTPAFGPHPNPGTQLLGTPAPGTPAPGPHPNPGAQLPGTPAPGTPVPDPHPNPGTQPPGTPVLGTQLPGTPAPGPHPNPGTQPPGTPAPGTRPPGTPAFGTHPPAPHPPAPGEPGPADALARHLAVLSRAGALVVMLDHAHRADEASLRMLARLARRVPDSRLLLIVAYRTEEAPALQGVLAAPAGTGPARIELRGLGPRDTRALASALVGGEVSPRTAEGLCARSGGNPFFLREMIRLLAGEQRTAPSPGPPVAAPVRQVVLQRLARLPEPAAELLAVAAVAGRHFDVEVVADVAGVEIDTALAVLDHAIAAGLVDEDPRHLGWFRFTDTVVAEALYETTGRMRRGRLRLRIEAAAGRAWTAGRPGAHLAPAPTARGT
ncbi:BTAD domain-containing putative transcriptional regulator [Streptomyces sp. NPDC002394]